MDQKLLKKSDVFFYDDLLNSSSSSMFIRKAVASFRSRLRISFRINFTEIWVSTSVLREEYFD